MKYAHLILFVLFTQLFTLSLQAEKDSRGIEIVPCNQRYALLIGVNRYPNEKFLRTLPSAVKDMEDLADALEKYAGFPRENITLMTDDSPENLLPTRENIRKQIARIRSLLSKDDLLIVAFSGHGVMIDYGDGEEAKPFFCVRDTDLPDTKTLMSRDWLFKEIDSCKSKKKIFLCDACRTLYTKDKLTEIATRSGKSASIRSLQDPSESWGYNYILMSSCAVGQNSIDTGTNGLFTKFLVEGLRTSRAAKRDGDLTANSWYEYAAKQTQIVSAQMIEENPELVIGCKNQTKQEPQFKCQGEMGYLVIAKLAPVDHEIIGSEDDGETVPLKSLKPGASKVVEVDGIKYTFHWCPAGEFMMGSPADEPGWSDDEKRHKVKLTKGFWMLETEVTQEMWKSIMGVSIENQARKMLSDDKEFDFDSFGKKTIRDLLGYPKDTPPEQTLCGAGPDRPVYYVNWQESMEFCRRLSMRLGMRIQLPTEAQWEYACRAGTETALPNGPIEIKGQCNAPALDPIAWYGGNNSQEFTGPSGWNSSKWAEMQYPGGPCGVHPTGKKNENAWGLRDMIGNVWEWCSDYYDADYYSRSPESDPENKDVSSGHVLRGGSWDYGAGRCRSAARNRNAPEYRYYNLGFRVILVPDQDEEEESKPDPFEPGDRNVLQADGIEYAFRWCPSGEFTMGSPTDEPGRFDDETPHKVKITQGFWMLETEVTQEMWHSVMGTSIEEQAQMMLNDDSLYKFSSGKKTLRDYYGLKQNETKRAIHGNGEKYPVYYVNWNESQEFCRKLGKKLGLQIQLPTEAQWEYACRAGKTTALPNGPLRIKGKMNAPDLDPIAWYGGNSSHEFNGRSKWDSSKWKETQYPGGPCGAHPVGMKKPNAWGLHDMIGNVMEWCFDYYDKNYYAESPNSDPENLTVSSSRVYRGGSWDSSAGLCRSAYRDRVKPDGRSCSLGLRIIFIPGQDK